jgi:putative endonuclease
MVPTFCKFFVSHAMNGVNFAWQFQTMITPFLLQSVKIEEIFNFKSMLFHYDYLLKCQTDKSWYIGYSDDLKQRVKDHQSGHGCRTTSMKKDWKLIYYESYLNKADALGREKFLKGGSGRKYLRKQLKNYFEEDKI